MSRAWPADYDAECYVLLPIPVATVPIVAGKLGELENRSDWTSESDWKQGYQFSACLQECLMQCGQSFSETMTLLAVALGANEIEESDLAPAFPALAERLAVARAADTAGVLTKQSLTLPPSTIIRLSELLSPFVQAGDPGGATPNLFGVLRSAWNFDSIRVTGLTGEELTEIAGAAKETSALLAVLAGLQEQAIADVKAVWPHAGAELEEAQGREQGNGTNLLDQGNAAAGNPSAIIRLSEIARLMQGTFPDTGSLWWYEAGEPVTLYDLYQQQSGLSDEPAPGDEGINWIDYVSDLIGIPTDLSDLLDSFVPSPGKLKKDGLMIALIAVEFMNLSMTSNLLLNLIGKDKMFNNSPGAPAATHDYLEAMLKATRGAGIQRSETDWAGSSVGAGLAPDGTPPGDSVLQGIRGDTEASATRNIIDTQPDLTMSTLETYLDELMQGSLLPDGRVNLYALDDTLHDMLAQLECVCKVVKNIVIEMPDGHPYDTISPAATTGSGSLDCQRARWLVDSIGQVGEYIFSTQPATRRKIQDFYEFLMGTSISAERSAETALAANSQMQAQGANWIAFRDWFGTVADTIRCAIFEGTSPSNAYNNYNVSLDALGAGALPYPTVVKLLLEGSTVTALFDESLPLNPDTLNQYSSDCSDCGGVGQPLPGDDIPAERCTTSNVGDCGQTKTINSYKYRPTRVQIREDWDATRSNTNGYLTGDCGAFSEDGIFLTNDMQGYTLHIVDDQGGYGYNDVVSEGGTVFWVDNPQSDSDMETAATSNAITDSLLTLPTATTLFTVIIKYPEGATFPPHPLVRICAPELV